MKIQKTAAATLLLSTMLALPQLSLAGKPDRDPSSKDCPNPDVVTACSEQLDYAYDLIGWLIGNNADLDIFLSRNPDQDAGTLQCKVSGAELKLSQDKIGEAAFLVDTAIEKIWTLYGQGKLSWDGVTQIGGAFDAAKTCLDSL